MTRSSSYLGSKRVTLILVRTKPRKGGIDLSYLGLCSLLIRGVEVEDPLAEAYGRNKT